MATEYSPGGFHSYAVWVTSGATDYLRGDVAIKGGITACLKPAHLAEAFQMNFEIHHGGNSLNHDARYRSPGTGRRDRFRTYPKEDGDDSLVTGRALGTRRVSENCGGTLCAFVGN